MDFIENKPVHPRSRGSVEVICGSMFSGKTEELIRRLRRANFAKQKVELFKPVLDKRYSDTEVTSHDARILSAMAVETASQILLWVGDDVDVVGIDEAQFFDKALVVVCNTLANNGVRVIVAGLDMDYLGKPFGPVPELMAIAEFVSKVHAICIHCGNPAQFSYRKVTEDKLVMLGLEDSYAPLCRSCFGEITGKSGIKEA